VNASGYNSGDEYGPCDSGHTTEAEWLEVHNFSVCHITVISWLTKMIRSGITFVSRNLR